MEAATRYVQVNDARLAYRDMGSGQPILFVHGAISDHRVWRPQFEAFESRYRCIALDLRNFGTSSGGDGSDFTLKTHSSDLCAFIEALQTGPVHLVGHSYGSVVGLAATVARPDLVAALLLDEPTLATAVTDAGEVSVLRAARAELAPALEALSKGDTSAALESFVDWVAFPGAFASLPIERRSTIGENARTLQPFLSAPPPRVSESDLAGIKVPISLTVGERTRPHIAVQVRALQRLLAHSTITTIPNGYHGSIFVDSTEFNRALAKHLNEQRAAEA
jgi:pimeloyl-ACP methyl ester carboxylesterase